MCVVFFFVVYFCFVYLKTNGRGPVSALVKHGGKQVCANGRWKLKRGVFALSVSSCLRLQTRIRRPNAIQRVRRITRLMSNKLPLQYNSVYLIR